jgi:membrane protein implicated in regulation of membrane protease activity
MSFFDHLIPWHWMILGVALVILEALAPGVIFLWMGIAALITGLIAFAADGLSWQFQTLMFAGLSIVSVTTGRMWIKRRQVESDHPTLNRRGEQYIGRTFTLSEPIVNGIGKLRADDTTWKISGDDLPEGSRVRVVGANGTILRVETTEGPNGG